ncbi:hypothetical protein C8Q75DRAFT_758723 [Abortiporus biennis]|nr:hypothetical protein C8Q75DRAFT_758723 [Abortiporus biennis]
MSESFDDAPVDPKFPTTHPSGLPPSPSVENPGRVYPWSDPKTQPATPSGTQEAKYLLGNPYALAEVFSKLDIALNEAIAAVENEERSVGGCAGEESAVEKFKRWRYELEEIRRGTYKTKEAPGTPQEGGLFAD